MSEQFCFPVVSIIIEHPSGDGRVLMQQRDKDDPPGSMYLFELPQGRIRRGELILDALDRELSEETGLNEFHPHGEIRAARVRGEQLQCLSALVVSESGGGSYLAVCVIGKANGELRASDESSGHQWLDKHAVSQLISAQQVFPLNVLMLTAYFGL